MGRFSRDKPIVLYSKIDDRPDIESDVPQVVGIRDSEQLQDVKVLVLRPTGERWGVLTPSKVNIEGFGEWWAAILNLNFTDEFGNYIIKWIWKTNDGEITSEYSIEVTNHVLIPYWNFQKVTEERELMELPEDIKQKLGDKNAD